VRKASLDNDASISLRKTMLLMIKSDEDFAECIGWCAMESALNHLNLLPPIVLALQFVFVCVEVKRIIGFSIVLVTNLDATQVNISCSAHSVGFPCTTGIS
jgi:hypothetical protein